MGRRLVCPLLLCGFCLGSGWSQPTPPRAEPDRQAASLKVRRFELEGNTLLTEEDIRKVFDVYEGKSLTLADMKEAAADLTSIYQRKGYYLVRALIPEQDFSSDVVRMLVV